MHEVIDFQQGGYRFIKGPAAYSLGVAALPGYQFERVRFQTPVPLDNAFRQVSQILEQQGRPASALAACELRSPAQLTEEGFRIFNERYFGLLRGFGFPEFNQANPIARTNVCPTDQTLEDTCMYAFTFTVPGSGARPSFVLAGAVDLDDGDGDLSDLIVARDELDGPGFAKKARHALADLERRFVAFGLDWSMTTANAVYSKHDIFEAVTKEISARGAARAGTTWHLCQPPIGGLEFEMDTRSVSVERTA